MSTVPAGINDVDDGLGAMLGSVGRHWGLLLFFGIVSIIAGLIAIFWPGPTFVVVALFFGIWLLVAGVLQIVQAFSHDRSGGSRGLLAISGTLTLILGLLCFRGPLQAAYILLLLIAFGWIIRGVLTFVVGLSGKGIPGRGWAIFAGIVLVIGGVVLLVWPIGSAKTLAVVSGIVVLLFGVLEVVAAFQARKLA
ncbi:MAG TPA: HdeD family acid-resistance protein [Candidatus Nanopelagicales bacterium]|jgi:uncharacterized membrane protein HdeD (DUF308 family)|nr:HdeD family acid-resistance protein [Candidatus Nanopelagicales bacterium]